MLKNSQIQYLSQIHQNSKIFSCNQKQKNSRLFKSSLIVTLESRLFIRVFFDLLVFIGSFRYQGVFLFLLENLHQHSIFIAETFFKLSYHNIIGVNEKGPWSMPEFIIICEIYIQRSSAVENLNYLHRSFVLGTGIVFYTEIQAL